MSQKLAELQALAQQAVDVIDIDMTETGTSGTFENLPAGTALGRFVQYIEFGKHAGEYQGKPKPPAPVVRLGFALWGPLYTKDGKPSFIRSSDLNLGNNEKAKAKIAFDRMNFKGTAKGFAQLLGNTYLVPITLDKSETTGKEYNNINWAGISAAIDPATGIEYNIPQADDDMYKLFIWNMPTIEGWKSIEIEGVNAQGKSKNWLQEKCLKATDFVGSALEKLLGGGVPDITQSQPLVPEITAPVSTEPAANAVVEVPALPVTPTIPAIPTV